MGGQAGGGTGGLRSERLALCCVAVVHLGISPVGGTYNAVDILTVINHFAQDILYLS